MPPPPPEGINTLGPEIYRLSFRRLLAEAVSYIANVGYVSREKIEEWLSLLRNAAERELGSEEQIDDAVRSALGSAYRRFVDNGKVLDFVPGVTRFNLSMVKPQLRSELDRRILAAADLIKIHRREAVERTLQRFSGWSTSIPPGGDGTIDKRETRSEIGKSVAQFKYERRRVDIDQSHKLIANVSNIVAVDAGAIAGVWHSHGEHDKSYNARKDHLERAGKVYAIRGSWAVEQGLMNKGAGYTDEMTAPAQEPFCRCYMKFITSPRRLPDQMLTRKGQEWIARGRLETAA